VWFEVYFPRLPEYPRAGSRFRLPIRECAGVRGSSRRATASAIWWVKTCTSWRRRPRQCSAWVGRGPDLCLQRSRDYRYVEAVAHTLLRFVV
jgi:hypothetical protein